MKTPQQTCAICGKSFSPQNLVPGETIREEIAAEILESHPDWSPEKLICKVDLSEFRSKYVHNLLESEKGELSTLEQEV